MKKENVPFKFKSLLSSLSLKLIAGCLFFFLLTAFIGPVSFQDPSEQHDICDIENTSFLPGEEIVYKVYYNWNFVWLSAGEVTFKVTEDYNQYHLSAKGRTYASYEWFYKVRDNYDTYLNKETLLPTVSVRDVQEGGYHLYDKVTFDQHGGNAVSLRGRSNAVATKKEFKVSSCMHDMLSIVYHIRNVNYNNFKKNQDIPIKVFLDREVYPLNVQYQGKEVKDIKGLGKFNTVLVSPQVVSGEVFKEGSQMKIWATDDGNRIPLLIESPVSVGSVKVILKSYKGLRHPMTSKIN